MILDLNYDLASTDVVEFGVGRDAAETQHFLTVPVGARAQDTLSQIASDTWNEMLKSVQGHPSQVEFGTRLDANELNAFVTVSDDAEMRRKLDGGPSTYELAEKYAGTEYLYLPADDDKVSVIRNLHYAHLDVDTHIFDDVGSIFCYFVRMIDGGNRRLTAIKRATTFKGLATKRNLLSMSANILDIMDDNVFKLDSSFDIICDSEHVHIWRPSSFEAIGKLQADILSAVEDNIGQLQKNMNFVDFGPIGHYASGHVMGARYLASIRSQSTSDQINKDYLIKLCRDTGVSVSEQNGKVVVDRKHIVGFLEVLDRRRYGIELIDGKPEQFRASSRQRINY